MSVRPRTVPRHPELVGIASGSTWGGAGGGELVVTGVGTEVRAVVVSGLLVAVACSFGSAALHGRHTNTVAVTTTAIAMAIVAAITGTEEAALAVGARSAGCVASDLGLW